MCRSLPKPTVGIAAVKLYDCETAPNPRRVRIFLAEKGISVPMVQVDLRNAAQLEPDYMRLNPFGLVPMLELDDGTRIGESVAICRYFEELHPEPPLMGIDPLDKAVVEMWQRRVEMIGFDAAGDVLRNRARGMAGRAVAGVKEETAQIPELVERGLQTIGRFYRQLDERLGESPFIAGERFTIADITGLCMVDFAKWSKITIPEDQENLLRWYETVSARPSAAA